MKYLAGYYYHIYNRGVAKQAIFSNRENYLFLLKKIKEFLPHYQLTIIAYCLMPNHYHLLIRCEEDDQVPPFIQRLFNSYTQAYNKENDRSGTLFESRAKSKLVDSDEYILQLCRYIHLNPVQAKITKLPEDWDFSNYQEWVGLRRGLLFDPQLVQDFFPTLGEYRKFVESEIDDTTATQLTEYLFD